MANYMEKLEKKIRLIKWLFSVFSEYLENYVVFFINIMTNQYSWIMTIQKLLNSKSLHHQKKKVSFRIFTSQNKFIHDKITCVSVISPLNTPNLGYV